MRTSALLPLLPLAAASGGATVEDPWSASSSSQARLSSEFDWASLAASKDLEYYDCYGEYKCARLELPLNWLDESNDRTVGIAIMKLPAAVPDDDPSFGGTVFTNPGGPGLSGVNFLPRMGRHLQKVLDKPGKRHYEILSFDARGVGFSTPLADCYEGNEFARKAFTLENRGSGELVGAGVTYNKALFDAQGLRCKQAYDAGNEIFPHAGTPNVARDMVEMIDKIEELRRREAGDEDEDEDAYLELRKRSGEDDDKTPRLQYVGFSYGTLLGNYFASMFPGRVGRIILDSVCDVYDYATGPGWLTNTEDMDLTFDEFFNGCHEAGPEVCALARASDFSGTDIRFRVWNYIAQLDEEPATAVSPEGYLVAITGKDVRYTIGNLVYKPIYTFKLMARMLDESMRGDHTILIRTITASALPVLEQTCPNPSPSGSLGQLVPSTAGRSDAPVISPPNSDGLPSVVCSDGDDITGQSTSWWRQYIGQLKSVSRVWGDAIAYVRFPCSNWPFRANWVFKGPFETPEHSSTPAEGKPLAPLLFLNNDFDPVTPQNAAREMAAMHAGARLVVQGSMGHGVLGGAPSACTRAIAAEYFDTGAVPDAEVFCEAECGPWDDECVGAPGHAAASVTGGVDGVSGEELMRFGRYPLGV
ncbi:hypothetical protein N3K66_008990 [Trichothecium roseum]|uniref:Uncharacterized protein n=1 Tax=Trichothecium roseum TaxID=47278 RepID=A0ACC0UPQ8_9HYPO|nr:hypothetical protein N3K66_008990 [Trichothecium roseum]